MRVDGPLLIAAALLGGATAAAAPLASSLAALGVALVVAPRVRVSVLLGAVLAFGAGAWRAHRACVGFEAERVHARDALGPPARCFAEGTIVTSPTWRQGAASYLVDLEHADCEGRRLPPVVRARVYGGPVDLARGDRVEVTAQLAPVRLFRELELPDPVPRAARHGTLLSGMALSVVPLRRAHGWRALIDAARAHARSRIQASFAPTAAGMARALVLGENDLDPADDEAFRASGLSHMLAVSGTHLVFAVVALVRAFAYLLARVERLSARFEVSRLASALGALLALTYADFAGGSGSAWRAAWMLAAALGARALGRRPRIARVLAASLVTGALIDPLAVYDVSFLLSAAATIGLVVFGRPLAARCASWPRLLRHAGESVAATVASMLPCAPLLALLAPTLTIAGIVANVVAAPFGEVVALPLCLAHGLLALLPAAERGVALVASGALLIVKRVAQLSADATWLAFRVPAPTPWHFALLAVGGAAFLTMRRARAVSALATFAGLAALELATHRAGHPRGRLRVTALDVGQGDSTLIDLPDGRLMLIDGGGFVGSPVDPGTSVILPVLRARRRARVDIAVLSHAHPDHFTGLASALPEVEVGELWDSGQGEAEGAGPLYAALIANLRGRGIPIRHAAWFCGRSVAAGGAVVEPLAPCPDFVPRGPGNDNSIVLRIRYGARRALLVGDAERDEERRVLGAHAGALRADFLKVGHHGSRTSTSPDFLRAVSPAFATISCGVRNRYGHPRPETLATLAAAGVRALRLDRVGAVEWATDGREVTVRAYSVPR
ncbi:MAG: ComEC/Rec2 family competence protein [Sorangiineae bacterium]|nr:ComEC/Rec2 family competence protein [Polyangiaceae bacterium]MEB2322560.1 ComEC/Rec2 family competence protein [Sorangiineae bacterium]